MRGIIRYFRIFADNFWKILALNLIYTAFCVPVLTFGAATAALTAVCSKFVLEEPVFVFHEFFKEFKRSFKTATPIGILNLVISGLYLYAIWFFVYVNPNYAMSVFTVAAFGLVTSVNFYLYPQIAALSLTFPAALKNAVMLVFLGVVRTLAAIFVFAASICAIALTLPYSIVALPFLPAAWICFTVLSIC